MKILLHMVEQVYTWFYLKLLKYRGTRELTSIPEYLLRVDGISVITVSGYNVSLYCKEIKYQLRYSNTNYSPVFTIYKLYGLCDGHAPERLKTIIRDDVYLPRLFPTLLTLNTSRRLMLESYLDILRERLKHLYASEGIDISDEIKLF